MYVSLSAQTKTRPDCVCQTENFTTHKIILHIETKNLKGINKVASFTYHTAIHPGLGAAAIIFVHAPCALNS